MSATNAPILVGELLLALVVLSAGYVPAQRVPQVNLLVVLRDE